MQRNRRKSISRITHLDDLQHYISQLAVKLRIGEERNVVDLVLDEEDTYDEKDAVDTHASHASDMASRFRKSSKIIYRFSKNII